MNDKWTKGARPQDDSLAQALRDLNQAGQRVHTLLLAWNKDLCDREDVLSQNNQRQRELNELTRGEVMEAWRIYDAALSERGNDRTIPRPMKPDYPRDFLRRR